MKWTKFLLTALSIFCINGLMAQGLGIIPEPYLSTKGNGLYTLPKTISISAPSSANAIAETVANQLKLTTGKTVNFSKSEPTIEFSIIKDDVIGDEGYLLNVNDKGIQVKANTNAGLFYGWQTVQQLLPAAIYGKTVSKNTNWQLSHCSIIDKPRFSWRGMMLDVSRHFFSKADVKVFIDDMVRYKYNRFHWHLTDDQGWRIEILVASLLWSLRAAEYCE